MTKAIEDSFTDWEGDTFGLGYGSGEEHTIGAPMSIWQGGRRRSRNSSSKKQSADSGNNFGYERYTQMPNFAWVQTGTEARLRAVKPNDDLVIWLREIDAGTDAACWVVCNKVDSGAIAFVPR